MKFTVLKVGKKIADQPPAREGLPPNAERIEWDPGCPGLGLRLRGASTNGTWVYVRKVDGVKVKRTLGRADAIDCETARAMAARIEAERQPSPPWLTAAHEKGPAPTVEDFGEVCPSMPPEHGRRRRCHVAATGQQPQGGCAPPPSLHRPP